MLAEWLVAQHFMNTMAATRLCGADGIIGDVRARSARTIEG